MTSTDIVDRILTRIDDDAANPVSVTEAEALAAANEGQELFSWLTLCLEATAPVTIPAATPFSSIRSVLPDFLVPLQIVAAGTRLRPETLASLDASNRLWQFAAGLPKRYVFEGFNLWAVTPQPALPVLSQWIYARSPITMVDGSTPEIPERYHQSLVDYGIYRVKLKEGAQGLNRGMARLNLFLDAATEHGDFVRARSRAARYDVEPFELALFDRARLISLVKKRRQPAAAPTSSEAAA